MFLGAPNTFAPPGWFVVTAIEEGIWLFLAKNIEKQIVSEPVYLKVTPGYSGR
jgi:hypothetical protein